MGQFVSKILGSTEVVWGKVFQQSSSQYRPPTLVLYDGQVRSACGMGQAAMGPFYCPGDEKLYIDLAFFRDLQTHFRAPGDFAQAYVIAHEVGHHVQKLTGTFQKMEAVRGRASQAEQNQTSVRMELQADCYAGVWGHLAGTMNQLDSGDIAEGLTPRQRSVTTACRSRLMAAAWYPSRSPTAHRSSACAGSSVAWTRVAQRTATRSRPTRFEGLKHRRPLMRILISLISLVSGAGVVAGCGSVPSSPAAKSLDASRQSLTACQKADGCSA
jgi:hypothetical protein